MTHPSFRDAEQLSACLDGQCSPAEKARLDLRLKADPALAALLGDLRQVRTLLRLTPKRPIPRNFMLTPKMAGIRPPLPRLVPAFTWASAVSMLLFVFTLGTSLVGRLSFGAGAPMLAAAPAYGYGGGPPEATEPPVNENVLATTTPEADLMAVQQSTPMAAVRSTDTPSAPKTQPEPQIPCLILWPALAILFIAVALLIRWVSNRAFKRKIKS
jgi:hypothetical protein